MAIVARDHEAEPALARDDLFERKPPGFAETIGKRGRHVNRERYAMPLQHRIGRGDHILGSAVEGQADEPPVRRHRHRAATHLVHPDDIIFPSLQRPEGLVEEFRGDLGRLQRLERRPLPRAHAHEPQDGADAALLPDRATANIGETEAEARQPSIVGCHNFAPFRSPVVITLC